MRSLRRFWLPLVAAVLVIALSVGGIYLRGPVSGVSEEDALVRFREGRAAGGPAVTEDNGRGAAATTARPVDPRGSVRVGSTSAPAVTDQKAADVTRRNEAVSVSAARSAPAPGVYTYATSGGEEVDVFGGSRHEYPEKTTITVRHAGCGLIERWDALEQRWDEKETCPTELGERLLRTTAYHEFFRQGDAREMRCDETSMSWPADPKPGTTWQTRCRADNSEVVSNGRILAHEVMRVGDVDVPVIRAVSESAVGGSQKGGSRTEVWRHAETGLVVRQISRVETSGEEPVVGRVTYTESYEIRLLRLEPRV